MLAASRDDSGIAGNLASAAALLADALALSLAVTAGLLAAGSRAAGLFAAGLLADTRLETLGIAELLADALRLLLADSGRLPTAAGLLTAELLTDALRPLLTDSGRLLAAAGLLAAGRFTTDLLDTLSLTFAGTAGLLTAADLLGANRLFAFGVLGLFAAGLLTTATHAAPLTGSATALGTPATGCADTAAGLGRFAARLSSATAGLRGAFAARLRRAAAGLRGAFFRGFSRPRGAALGTGGSAAGTRCGAEERDGERPSQATEMTSAHGTTLFIRRGAPYPKHAFVWSEQGPRGSPASLCLAFGSQGDRSNIA